MFIIFQIFCAVSRFFLRLSLLCLSCLWEKVRLAIWPLRIWVIKKSVGWVGGVSECFDCDCCCDSFNSSSHLTQLPLDTTCFMGSDSNFANEEYYIVFVISKIKKSVSTCKTSHGFRSETSQSVFLCPRINLYFKCNTCIESKKLFLNAVKAFLE